MRQRMSRLDVQALANAAALYCKDVGVPPQRLAEMAPPECSGLRCTLRDLRADQWGRPYVLEVRGRAFLVSSTGPDGRLGTPDDIVATNACP